MTSYPSIRDPKADHLITPDNAALLIIDYQPVQVHSIGSRDKRELVSNIRATARTAKAFGLPVVLTTVNVSTGVNQPMIPQITEIFPGLEPIDRTAINAWEDVDFVNAVRATGRKKLIMAALWTEVCLTFPALDALNEGYEVYPVVDAIGGTSSEAHEVGLRRVEQAGAQLITWPQLICELQRDWNRRETKDAFAQILFAIEGV